MVQKIRRGNFEIVVRGVSECAFAVAIAQRPNARDTAAELIVHFDVAVLVNRNARLIQTQVVRVGPPSHGQQDMCPADLRSALSTIRGRDNLLAVPREANAFRIHSNVNTLAFQNFLDCRRYVFVFAVRQPRPHLNDGDFAPETAEHLRELKTHVASAHNNQVPGKKVDVQQ